MNDLPSMDESRGIVKRLAGPSVGIDVADEQRNFTHIRPKRFH
jgi:hypothetical protein